MDTRILRADWHAPHNVQTLITTRMNGYSTNEFAECNLANHVGDSPANVSRNRQLLNKYLPSSPIWLKQTHSNEIINLDSLLSDTSISLTADASFTSIANKVCAVLTADCLPILLTGTSAHFVAAVHAGWRGLQQNIIANSINKIITTTAITRDSLLCYIAPRICHKHFIVGDDVRSLFVALDSEYQHYFTVQQVSSNTLKYHCDLSAIATHQLRANGLLATNIFDSQLCTFCQHELFYSYRRDGSTGRIASLIWFTH